MFRGEFAHNVDAKSRIILPAKFREELGQKFVITKGLDGCLFVFPMNIWQTLEEKINKIPITNPEGRKFSRFFLGAAYEAETDNQGRVNLPQNLKEYSSIIKDVVSIGLGSRIEIWSSEKWTSYQSDDSMNDEIASKMAEFGI